MIKTGRPLAAWLRLVTPLSAALALFASAASAQDDANHAKAPDPTGQTYAILVPSYATLAPNQIIPMTEDIDKQQEAIKEDLFSQLSQSSFPDDKQVKATFVADPSVRRTPNSVPILLKIYNNSNKSIRLLNLFTPKLLPAAVHLDLQGGDVNRLGSSLFYEEKVSLYRWQYVYITLKPHHAFQTGFDLVQMTTGKQPIPPGKYKLSGWYSGGNMGYPSDMGSDADVFNGNANIAAITLVISKPLQVP